MNIRPEQPLPLADLLEHLKVLNDRILAEFTPKMLDVSDFSDFMPAPPGPTN